MLLLWTMVLLLWTIELLLVVDYCVTIVLLVWTIGLLLVVLLLCYYWVRYPCDLG